MHVADLLNPAFVYRRRKRIGPRLASALWAVRSDRTLASLRGVHARQRAFVVGTGPSLRVDDLERLKGEVTFGVNQIVAAYEHTDWRPTYYCAVDQLVFENDPELAHKLDGSTCLFPLALKPYVGAHRGGLRVGWFREKPADWDGPGAIGFSDDAHDHVVGGATVVYAALQLAFYRGVREVYLLGVDHAWRVSGEAAAHANLPRVLVRDGTPNHFLPACDRPGTLWCAPEPERHERAFASAKAAYERAGGAIRNASRGGALEVFERVSLDDVLG